MGLHEKQAMHWARRIVYLHGIRVTDAMINIITYYNTAFSMVIQHCSVLSSLACKNYKQGKNYFMIILQRTIKGMQSQFLYHMSIKL